MTKPLTHWRHHLDPTSILNDPHVPSPSTLMGIAQRLDAVLSVLTTLSDDRPEEKEYGLAVADLAVDFATKILRHLGLGDDGPAPGLLNLKMAQMVLENLLATVQGHLERWQQEIRGQVHEEGRVQEEPAETPSRLVIDQGTFSVTYKGKRCELGNTKAFRLLERLARSPGIYIHLDTLKIEVWKDEDAEDEAVQRQISTLRNKLRGAGIEGIQFQSQPQSYRLLLR